ncbi:MAG TPA: cytochrome P450 [Longimicrobiaceae bacterium]|nr:cytochrome P450 [Longimicrobiaceae bacterium]
MISHPPGPRSRIPIRLLFDFRRDPLTFVTETARRYGDVASWKFGPRDMYLLSHPDYVKEVLVTRHRNFIKSYALQRSRVLLGQGLLTSEGEFHLRQRRLSQPAFHRERVDAYGQVMSEYAARTAERWRDGATLDITPEMMRLTLAVVGKTLFDADVEGEAEEIGAALTDAMLLFDRLTVPFNELLDRLPLPGTRRFYRARARLDETIYRIIEERRRSGEDRGDLLSMLLLAQDTEGDMGRMTDEQLRDEALTIFLAGHETTAIALTWTWYLLAQNPEIESRLHAELDEVLEGHLPTAEDLPRLPYTRMVIAESMRLYPPAWIIGRQPLEEFEIGGFRIPAGSIVMMSQWVIHRDPRFYTEPQAFRPERWQPDAEAARHRFAYFPFGAGPRKCIGEGFAWMEGILVLAALAQRWRMRLLPGDPAEARPLITLRPKDGVRMILQQRKAAPVPVR